MQRAERLDPRDLRDLEVLALRQHGLRVNDIAKRTGVDPGIVETILALDAEEFPHEPLKRTA